MKMYPKTELKMKDGLIVNNDDDVVVIDPFVVYSANVLETKFQEAEYLSSQPVAMKVPSLDGFVRKSEQNIEMFECDTPISDERAKESIAFMNELDDLEMTNRINQKLIDLKELIMFAKNDSVLDTGCSNIVRFDTPVLGNPLEWTEDTISTAVAKIYGCEVKSVEDGEQE